MKDIYRSFKKTRWFPLIVGILSVVFGVLCVANPAAKMESIALYIGLAILLYGAFAIVVGVLQRDNRKLFYSELIFGAVLIVLAIFDFANLELIGKYLPSLVGFFMILSAGADLFRSLVMRRNEIGTWWLSALLAAVVLVLGFVFLLRPGFVGQTIGIFTGVALLINGVANLLHFFQYGK